MEPPWGNLGAILGPSWGRVGASWCQLGAFLGLSLGAITTTRARCDPRPGRMCEAVKYHGKHDLQWACRFRCGRRRRSRRQPHSTPHFQRQSVEEEARQNVYLHPGPKSRGRLPSSLIQIPPIRDPPPVSNQCQMRIEFCRKTSKFLPRNGPIFCANCTI